jgi:hypothetical protein
MSTPTWTYSGDPTTTPLDELRFILQDTDPSFQLLQDAELNYLTTVWMERYDSLTFVAAVGAEIISRKFAGIVNVSADGIEVDTSQLAERYHTAAIQLRDEYKMAQDSGEIDISNQMVGYLPDPSLRPLRFGIGLDDNPEAGNQDFGGWSYNPFTMADVLAGLWG